jgi:hypothetical protein
MYSFARPFPSPGWSCAHGRVLCCVGQDGTTALLDACSRGDTPIVKQLLVVPGVTVDLPRRVREVERSIPNLRFKYANQYDTYIRTPSLQHVTQFMLTVSR